MGQCNIYETGQAQRRAGDYAASVKAFGRALREAAGGVEQADARLAIGLALESARRYAEARAAFGRVLAVRGAVPEQRARAQCSIGICHFHERNWPAAREAFEKVRAVPGAGAAWRAQAHLLIGRSWGMECLTRNVEAKRAFLAAERAWAAAAHIPGVRPAQKANAQANGLHMLASLAGGGIRVQAELRHRLAAGALLPASDACARWALGNSLFFEGRYGEARLEWARARAKGGLTPLQEADLQLHLGLSYYEEGRFTRARPALQRVAALPGAPLAQRREAALRLHLRSLVPTRDKVLTVLFIGASHTQQWEVPYMLEVLADSAPAGRPRIAAGGFLRGGTGISTFWEEGDGPDTARARIQAEPWDYVVFETYPFHQGRDVVNRYAAEFATLIREARAVPVMLEQAWTFKTYPASLRYNHAALMALGKRRRIPVAPVGLAWMTLLGPRSTRAQRLALYHPDLVHYSRKGAYLAACTLYATLTGSNPAGLTHEIPSLAPDGITPEDAAACQAAAWQACQETAAAQKGIPGLAVIPARRR